MSEAAKQPMVLRFRAADFDFDAEPTMTVAVGTLMSNGYTVVSVWHRDFDGYGELHAFVERPLGTEIPRGWHEA